MTAPRRRPGPRLGRVRPVALLLLLPTAWTGWTSTVAARDRRVVAEPPARSFAVCRTGGGVDCVVDGDTAWIGGVKVRVADIDAPETHPPRCRAEAELGERATLRLAELMNAGPFDVARVDRDEDRYGRKLRVLLRRGRSLGARLVAEGLARTWDGRRHPWC